MSVIERINQDWLARCQDVATGWCDRGISVGSTLMRFNATHSCYCDMSNEMDVWIAQLYATRLSTLRPGIDPGSQCWIGKLTISFHKIIQPAAAVWSEYPPRNQEVHVEGSIPQLRLTVLCARKTWFKSPHQPTHTMTIISCCPSFCYSTVVCSLCKVSM